MYLKSEVHRPGPEVRATDADEDHISEGLILVEVGAPLLELPELSPATCALQNQ